MDSSYSCLQRGHDASCGSNGVFSDESDDTKLSDECDE
jgi:hypothetical protein